MAEAPKRIQLKRTKGWRMPENTVKVTRPGPWGNPFRVSDGYHPEYAVRQFRTYVLSQIANGVGYPLAALRGKNLACFCKQNESCHADILLEFANGPLGDVSNNSVDVAWQMLREHHAANKQDGGG